jgi:MoaA/NifB/PqqE/SkfB family radical SAM enzyme
MECAVIVTYRCNARCQMCHTWKHPSDPEKEISPEVMDKIPGGQHRINLTGGEPALRDDLKEIVDVLVKKTPRLEISTNGFFTQRLVEIGEKYPQVTFRISVEGLPKLNDELRGIKNGFDHALKTVLSLIEVGVEDVGFGMVISDRNARDLLPLYQLCSRMGMEFATSTMHNSFYFHKDDNRIEDLTLVEANMKKFISALLQSKRKDIKIRIKDWGRAFVNLGFLRYMQGESRRLPCGAAQDLFFLDPYGQVLACNGSDELWIMGNLQNADFAQIWSSKAAEEVRRKVKECKKNCWMVGTAVPAMRKSPLIPLLWITKNKIRLYRGHTLNLN